MEKVGGLVCLVRVTAKDHDTGPGFAFGKDFEQKMAVAGDPRFDGSFRQIAAYRFAALRLLVRFEVDCAEPQPGQSYLHRSQHIPSVVK